ncbi:hypothetical protein FRC17_005040 [Serendipita sp. 399]|nr:hypothetical protein FRC17_005040 [Serendipita sp. 399]
MENQQKESAISKVPPEIWWPILYYAFVPKFVMDEVYEGNNWIADAESMACQSAPMRITKRKSQVCDLALVCKSWKHIVDQTNRRFVPVGIDKLTPEGFKEAWRMDIGDLVARSKFHDQLPKLVGAVVQWRALCMDAKDADHLSLLRFPHLRRLELYRNSSSDRRLSHPENLVGVLKNFKGALENLTWLEYRISGSMQAMVDDKVDSITLPNLQGLHYTIYHLFSLPYSRLILPSLCHLHIRAHAGPKELLPLRQLVEAYGQTLQSLNLDIHLEDTSRMPEDSYFPPWERVARLREFGLAAPALLHFPPLPSKHPLQIFAAQVWCVDGGLLSWLDSDNLKTIRLVNSRREAEGSLVPLDRTNMFWDSNRMRVIGPREMETLEAKARERGIILQSCSDPDGKL